LWGIPQSGANWETSKIAYWKDILGNDVNKIQHLNTEIEEPINIQLTEFETDKNVNEEPPKQSTKAKVSKSRSKKPRKQRKKQLKKKLPKEKKRMELKRNM